MWLKVIIGTVLIAHGVGHVLGLFPAFGWARTTGWSADSWALTGWAGPTVSHVVGIALWSTAMVTFVLAGLGVLGLWVPISWIRPLAVVGSVVSIVGIVLFWEAFPEMSSRVAALAVDVIVLWAVLVGHWPSSEIVPS